ncbi:ParB N-terminal domain-containing protein (plasmid) [Robbsia andropogonis]|uniref:ParB N-terminal domain-containing protein n=1 Tax=Robbsia andropogonis TaxID=28092 RepID=UPI003D1B2E32
MSNRLNGQNSGQARGKTRTGRAANATAHLGLSLTAIAEARWRATRKAYGYESTNAVMSPVSTPKRTRSSATTRAKPVKKGMQATVKVLRLAVAEIDFFEKNPRTLVNEKFEEIKESIRSRGIDQPIKVTQRPGTSRYVLAAGGNTRLRAIKELHAETGEERFAATDCIWTDYVDDIDIEVAHTVENEQRAPMCFWDRANNYVNILNRVSEQRGQKLSQQDCLDYLAQKGVATSRGTLWNWRFAVSNFQGLGAAAFLLSGEGTKAIQASTNKLQSIVKMLGLSSNFALEPIIEAACLDMQLEFDRTGEFSADALISRIYHHFAAKTDLDPLQLDEAADLAAEYHELTPIEFRMLLTSRGRKGEREQQKREMKLAARREKRARLADAAEQDNAVPAPYSETVARDAAELDGISNDVDLDLVHATVRDLLRTALEASSKILLSTPEDIPTDERAAKFQECFVNVSTTIEANA